MLFREFTIETDAERLEALQGFLYTLPIGGLVIDDPRDSWNVAETAPEWVIVDEDLLKDRDDPILVRAYVPIEGYEESALRISQRLKKDSGEGWLRRTGVVDEAEWADAWKQYFHPVPIGDRLLIKPSWEEVEHTDRVVLEIDPGMAFGSGAHETTRLCLHKLSQLHLEGKRVADVGTGSGILAVAAALFGAADVQAVDIDPMSLRMTRENAERNNVLDRIRVAQSDLLAAIEPPIDVLVSNILAEAITLFIPQLERVLTPVGEVIFSGIIVEKEEMVMEELRAHGYEILALEREGGWSLIHAIRRA